MAEKEVKEEVVEEVAVKPVKKTATKKTAEEKATTKKVAKADAEKETAPKAKKTTAKEKAVKEETKAEKPAKAEKVEKAEKAEKPAKKATKKVPKDKTVQFWGTGRRKKSVARVRIMLGNGKFEINGRDIEEYFGLENLKVVAKQPLTLTENESKFDVFVNVYGGGFTGQSGAIRMGLARALEKFDENLRPALKKAGYLTRDARIKERKKYGLLKARKDQPYVKR